MGNPSAPILRDVSEFESAVDIDGSWYPKWAILKTAYLFFDRGYFVFSQKSETVVAVSCRTKNPSDSASAILGDFVNELANGILREKLAEENRSVRESIFSGVMSMGIPKNSDQPNQTTIPPLPDKSIDEILKEIEAELGLEDSKK